MKNALSKLTTPILTVLIIVVVLGLAVGVVYNFLSEKALTTLTPTSQSSPFPSPSPTPKLPDNFPQTFPVLKGTAIESASSTSGDKNDGVSVIWRIESDLEKAVDFYETEFDSLEWDYKTVGDDSSTAISFSNDKLEGFIGLATDGTDTIISVTISIDKTSKNDGPSE